MEQANPCLTCYWYDHINGECMHNNPGSEDCWESEDKDNVDVGMVANWRLFGE